MKIDCLVLGDFQTNCYVVRESDDSQDCVVIDPGLSAGPLLDMLAANDLRPSRILLTHGHIDHIAGLESLRKKYPQAKICIGKEEASALSDPTANLAVMLAMKLTVGPADEELAAGDVLNLGDLEFQVLSTPGHTVGGVSYYCGEEGVVFTGDALFAGSIGRHDFPGGDLETLLQGIREQLFTLPDDTRVYSGHGPVTTIGEEKRSNPFF
ncbi:MAG: MBL fold metallo-hydrolase [Sedimentisphaerales bacterium]|nr:MBL fold metallo-hydrolase [Sedimentisphaerales bacterium]